MLKTNVLFPKRSKPIVQEEEMLEVQSGPRKMPLQVVNRQNTSKCIFQNLYAIDSQPGEHIEQGISVISKAACHSL